MMNHVLPGLLVHSVPGEIVDGDRFSPDTVLILEIQPGIIGGKADNRLCPATPVDFLAQFELAVTQYIELPIPGQIPGKGWWIETGDELLFRRNPFAGTNPGIPDR
jgi:hypothetical protein